MNAIKEAVQGKYSQAALAGSQRCTGQLRMRDVGLLRNGSHHVESLR